MLHAYKKPTLDPKKRIQNRERELGNFHTFDFVRWDLEGARVDGPVLVNPQLRRFRRTAAVRRLRRVIRLIVVAVGTFLRSYETLLGSLGRLMENCPGSFFVHRPIEGFEDR